MIGCVANMTAVEQGLSPSKDKYFLSWERSNGFPFPHAQPSPRLEEVLRDRVDKWEHGQTYPLGNDVNDPLVAHDCHGLEKRTGVSCPICGSRGLNCQEDLWMWLVNAAMVGDTDLNVY